MASKRERLRELLTKRIAQEQNVTLPEPTVAHLITTREQLDAYRLELAKRVDEIRQRQWRGEQMAQQFQESFEIGAQGEDYRWLWDEVPVSADMPTALFQRLDADEELHRLAVGGLVGPNWYQFTNRLREKYGMFETGYRSDVHARRRRGYQQLINWKLYIANHPELRDQSQKLQRMERLPSGYTRLTKEEQARRNAVRQRTTERRRVNRRNKRSGG